LLEQIEEFFVPYKMTGTGGLKKAARLLKSRVRAYKKTG